MVICKFYLQGTCKFGNNCRYDHQIDNYNSNYQNHPSSGTGSSILRQTHFNSNPNTTSIFSNVQQTPTPNVDANSLVKVVINDVTLAENGGQWRLSCYGPFSEKPAFPNFPDYSFEEIRSWFYDAKKNNQLAQFQAEWIRLQNEANMRLMALKNPTPDIINTIIALYNSKGDSQSSTTTNTAFTFTLQPSQQQFFQNPTVPSTVSNNSPFQQQSGSIFAPQTSIFNTQPATPANQNIFHNFQQPQQSQNQQSIFNQTPSPQVSIFNQPQPKTTPNPDPTMNVYSKIEDLTEDELNWFQSNDLTLDKIPEKPPTFELCFQT